MPIKLADSSFTREHELRCVDLNQGIHIENASMVLMILTLQFIRPLYRDKLVSTILRRMNDSSALILVEKLIGEDSLFNRLFIKYYYDYKKGKGSRLSWRSPRSVRRWKTSPSLTSSWRTGKCCCTFGFRYCDVFFKWYNFCGIIAVK